ncbi:MAG: sodium/proline symporter PutP [Oscillospiraceae bacterium]|jgi:sodium/proline symporter|nr:sodium/proline symporter PutP [Oscillospiraceae bacterium]
MDANTTQVLIAVASYMVVIVAIGFVYARKANESSENYFIGGRSLGPWVAAMSAEASDMSGWLLMGVPGLAYWCGFADAAWTAIGLLVGTYLNWLIVAKPLRRYSTLAGNSITIPEFFSNRFKEQKTKPLLTISSLMILIFFAVYAGSCFVAGGKLFAQIFHLPYISMMLIGAFFVVLYTFLGGFLAESLSDFIQGIVMVIALVAVLGAAVIAAGGPGAVSDNIKNISGFVDFFGLATPVTNDSGVQQILNGAPLWGTASPYGLLTILSTLSWGLGYFGMPQVLLRFFAIRRSHELTRSRRIATIWCAISLAAALFIGLVGRALFPASAELSTYAAAENVFIVISRTLFHPLLAGVMMAGILAAIMSSSDSYLLIASSAVSKDLFQGVIKRNATDKQVMLVSRITLLAVAVAGIFIALDENSVIFTIVSFAWAGFGASFGPLVLFSLFWKRCNHIGAVAGVITGGATVFIWKLLLKPLGGVFGIYELLPAFLLSCAAIVVVSLLTAPPSRKIQEEFEAAKTFVC